MKRFTLRELILCCVLSVIATVGLVVFMRMINFSFATDFVLKPIIPFFSPQRPKVGIFQNSRILRKNTPEDEKANINPTASVDLNAYLIEQKAYYSNLPKQNIQEKRLADQEKILEDYRKDPPAFINKYDVPNRITIFDAVIDGKNLLRVGRVGDGGKWVSDPQRLRPGAVVYSFGVGDDISFDVEMAGLFGCEVHAFDPAPSVEKSFSHYQPGTVIGKGKFRYHAAGLGPISTKPGNNEDLVLEGRKCAVKRLSEFAAELGHKHVDILKIDIEGGEMAALPEIISSGTLEKLSVKQLQVEFHLWDNERWIAFVRIIDKLREHGYLIFRKEMNPSDSLCAEFAFLGPE
jgi:hypothetical protein